MEWIPAWVMNHTTHYLGLLQVPILHTHRQSKPVKCGKGQHVQEYEISLEPLREVSLDPAMHLMELWNALNSFS